MLVRGNAVKRSDQLRVHRDQQRFVGFLLPHRDLIALDVLPSHPDDIAASLAGAEQQFERQSRLGAERMPCLELRDLGFGPGMEALANAPCNA